MNDDMIKRLYCMFDTKTAESIEKSYSAMLDEMAKEQEQKLSSTQFKVARKIILTRIAFYLSMKRHIDGEDALSYLSECFYKKTKAVSRYIKFLSKYECGCAFFRKAFSMILRTDIWVSEIKRNDKDAFIFDITNCLYKDLCDFYKCPELCKMFCDGDWVAFGDMKKLKLERRFTLGYGGDVCDFKVRRHS
jgi:hypothetical protein